MGLRLPETNETQPDRFPEHQHREYPKALNEIKDGKVVPVKDELGNDVIFRDKDEEASYNRPKSGRASYKGQELDSNVPAPAELDTNESSKKY